MRQAELLDGDIKTWVLGRAGENETTQVTIDITEEPYASWAAETTGGQWAILNIAAESDIAYLVTVIQPTSSDQNLRWTVKDSDIPVAGRGAMEVVYMGPTVDGSTETPKTYKSEMFYTSVLDSLGNTGDYEEGYLNWLTQILAAANQAIAARDAIVNMIVTANTLETGQAATVTKTTDSATGYVKLTFGLPKGNTGSTGPQGVGIASIATSRVGSGTRITITLTDGQVAYYDVTDGAVTSVDGETGAIKTKNIVDEVDDQTYHVQLKLDEDDGLLHIVGTVNT